MKLVMKWVGADVPSANRITLLRDTDGDGVAETRSAFLTGLNSPFGMALIGSDFYVANTDAVVRFPYQEGATEIAAQGVKVADLPGGPVNYHWTKNIVTSREDRACSPPSAPTAMRARTAWRRKKAAPRSWRLIPRPERRAPSPRVCVITRWASHGSPTVARCGSP